MEPNTLSTRAITFRRSAAAQVGGTMLAAAGGLLFLGFATLILLGFLSEDLLIRIVGAAGFGFFGLLMTLGAIAGARQGSDPRVAEIGPDGAWLPGMGRLAWDAIVEVRLERIRGVGSSSAPTTRQFRRLGFVPRDRSLRADAATYLIQRMIGLYYRLVTVMVPEIRLGGDDPAPFGVSELDIPRDFDRLLEAVAAFATVTDATAVRAQAHAARWAAPAASTPTEQVDLRELDAALAHPPGPSQGAGTTARMLDAGASLVAESAPAQPRGAFALPAPSTGTILFSAITFVAPLAVVVPLLLPQVAQGGTAAIFGLAFIGVFGIGFAAPGLVRTVRMLRRARERRSDPVRLRVGPDGIWTRDGGQLGWSDIRDIHAERSGRTTTLGGTKIERWRLVVEPVSASRSRGTATSDELDAPFDDVLELVRLYHPVADAS